MSYPSTRVSQTAVGLERSADLWGGVLEAFANDPTIGVLRSDDFTRPRAQIIATYVEGWFLSEDSAAGVTGESFNTTGHPDGQASVAATSGTDHQGIKAQAGPSASVSEGIVLPTHPTLGKAEVVFEAIVELNVAKNDTLFVGLAEQDSAILSTTSVPNDDLDYIGFYRLDSGDLQFIVRNDNAGGTAVEYNVDVVAAADVPDAADVKLGFRVDASGKVTITIDGVKVKVTSDTGVAINVPTTALPIEALSRTLLAARGETADNGTISVPCKSIDCFVAE